MDPIFGKKKQKSVVAFMYSVSERKWIKTSRGEECPFRNFLFDSIRTSSHLLEDGTPFIDKALYEKTMHEYKDSLKKVGVITQIWKRM